MMKNVISSKIESLAVSVDVVDSRPPTPVDSPPVDSAFQTAPHIAKRSCLFIENEFAQKLLDSKSLSGKML